MKNVQYTMYNLEYRKEEIRIEKIKE